IGRLGEVPVDDGPDRLGEILRQGEAPDLGDEPGPRDERPVHLDRDIVAVRPRPAGPRPLAPVPALTFGRHGRTPGVPQPTNAGAAPPPPILGAIVTNFKKRDEVAL